MVFVGDGTAGDESQRDEEKRWKSHGGGVVEENQSLAVIQATLGHIWQIRCWPF